MNHTSHPTRSEAWDLAQSISVRTHCRIYDQPDGQGGWDNVTRDTTMGDGAPSTPWAIYLADGDDYWLVCLDFDAHGDPMEADRQARACRALLESHHIPTVLCASGPDGGRHVWAATLEGIPADLMRSTATALKALWPLLDTSCLSNPRTGAARTPGSPHRRHGASQVIDGDTDRLELPTTRLAAWQDLARDATGRALDQTDATPDTAATKTGMPALDPTGHPWIPGRRASLPARARTLIDTPCRPGEDRSRRQWAILLACARAHWTWTDVAGLIGRPGMERCRGWRRPDGAIAPRPATGPRSATGMLAADWARAVAHAKDNPAQGADPTFDTRAWNHTQTLRGVLAAMASRPGRWERGGGAADRRVLTALVLLSSQAITDTIQADIRRLALLTGMGRETCRTALIRLADDGWITSQGRDGETSPNRWKINPRNGYPQSSDPSRPQVNTPPAEGAGTLDRKSLNATLSRWLGLAAHDAHTGGDTHLREGNQTADRHLHDDPTRHAQLERDLAETARRRRTTGTLERRAQTITDERIAWQWWRRELEWMRAPAPLHHERRTILLPDALHGRFPRIPRVDNRADYHRTMRAVRDLRAGTHPSRR